VRTCCFLSIWLIAALSLLFAQEEPSIKDQSPDGKFGLLLVRSEQGMTKFELIEVHSLKVVKSLAEVGHPRDDDCKLLWSADSQRAAFFEANRRGGGTTVYLRRGAKFISVELPEPPSCATAKQKKGPILKSIEWNFEPIKWLKSGALVLKFRSGWEPMDGNLEGCSETVTVAFKANQEAVVQSVTDRRKEEY
jgi:hypothetical protein